MINVEAHAPDNTAFFGCKHNKTTAVITIMTIIVKGHNEPQQMIQDRGYGSLETSAVDHDVGIGALSELFVVANLVLYIQRGYGWAHYLMNDSELVWIH